MTWRLRATHTSSTLDMTGTWYIHAATPQGHELVFPVDQGWADEIREQLIDRADQGGMVTLLARVVIAGDRLADDARTWLEFHDRNDRPAQGEEA